MNKLLGEYIEEMESVKLKASLAKFMEISSKGNLLLQYRLDNANLVAHPERTKTVLGLALNLASLLASLSSPFVPAAAESIVRQLNSKLEFIPETWDPEVLKPGHKIGKAEYLFTRIDDKKVAEWKEQFGGTQESRAAEVEAKRKKQEEKDRKKAKKAAGRQAPAPGAADGAPLETAATADIKTLPIREALKPEEK